MREISTETKIDKAKLLYANMESAPFLHKQAFAMELCGSMIEVAEQQEARLQKLEANHGT